MREIQRVAILGSGVMGAGIAAHCANAGCEVLLLDIVPPDIEEGGDRNAFAKGAVQSMAKANPEMLMHPDYASRIEVGNFEDDLHQLVDIDWVIEVVLERLDIKHQVYSNIAQDLNPEAVLSSNTSTLPRSALVEGMDNNLASRFLITHFFNPPRYLPLLEVVTGPEVSDELLSRFTKFVDVRLGKQVVNCNDCPGFIGNRLGVFFVQRAIFETLQRGYTVEQADAMLGRPIGLPKTGVFGLMDLVGIDLIPHIMDSLLTNLDDSDALHKFAGEGGDLIQQMIADGYTGRKGKGGFYRLNIDGEQRVKEARDLVTGEYTPADRKAAFPSAQMGKQGLRRLLEHPDEGASFVREIILDTLAYAATLVPEVTDSVADIDIAMRIGYNWKRGPFEMIDQLGVDWFIAALEESGREVPPLLRLAVGSTFHEVTDGELNYLAPNGERVVIARPPETLSVSDLKRRSTPLEKNPSASLWDAGDGVLLVEYHSKMNAMDPMSMEMLLSAVDIAEIEGWKGILIANDAQNFCAGANLGLALLAANLGAWKEIEDFITLGQEAYAALKYAEVPVVSASAGLCLGGGCEILLHSDAVQAHAESYIGLVEVGVGIIPAWGGCKEMLGRLAQNGFAPGGPMGPVTTAFETIGLAKVAKSAQQAQDIGYLTRNDRITMNRNRLIHDAKQLLLELAVDYVPPTPHVYNLPGRTGRAALDLAVTDLRRSGRATPHDVIVSSALAQVLTGGDTDMVDVLTEEDVLKLERESIILLAKNQASLARMENMLLTGKPLRN
ncbi:MAG: 3-hydroxyacyl-CoA dehydrogenase NAD-binding domain-containing protein [Candidatus Thalassarchaeaceae archaeon]|nr:3-hydroxyacyl-CoA dehydrogenase NAD-binding domain-containing protein [Candidatus Thalassarchaeaceae archaeon]